MKKTIFEQMGGTYTKVGDNYLPNLLPAEEQTETGLWGQRHLRHIKQHHRGLYTNLLTSGKLNGCLADIDKQAEDVFFRLVKQMAETEQLKADNQIEWVAQMNNIRSRATEIVNTDWIFA